jgi:glucokinase
MQDKILGIDIGATTVKYGALHNGGSIMSKGTAVVASGTNASLINQLAEIISLDAFANCAAIGIGSPGPLDLSRGTIVSSANMPQIRDCPLVPELQKRFPDKKFRLDNDANAATLGEKHFGLGRGLTNFAVFTLGTGVGGGCIFENQLRRGLNGNFFEVGHLPVGGFSFRGSQIPARLCGCGNSGYLETYASATGVSQTYFDLAHVRLSAAEIANRADGSDIHAISAYALAGTALGIAMATITQLLNITDFILTGGMAGAERHLRTQMEENYLQHTFPMFHPLMRVQFTEGDENAGILGAVALFLE